MHSLLAAAPIAIALVLLVVRVGPVLAGVCALVTAAAVTWLAFPTPVPDLRAGAVDIAPLSTEVVLILLGGILLNELLSARGVQERFGEWVTGVCGEGSRALLLVALGVTPFVESVTGFGVGAVVAIPLLRHLGFSPFRSAVAGLLGLVIVPWGALAPGTLVAARLTGVGFHQLGVRSALLSLPVFVLAGAAALILAVGKRRAVRAVPELLLVAGALWIGVLAVNIVVGTAVAGALGSLVALAAALTLARLREGSFSGPPYGLGRGLVPYAVLVAGLLAGRGLSALVGTGAPWWSVASSPATWLLLTCAATPALVPRGREPDRIAVRAAAAQWWPVAVTTALFLVLGQLMTVTGMSGALAHAAAQMGTGYPAIAPWIGALGGFLTGSNTGANAMFATSQAETARAIGYPVLTMVAVQNVSASLATMAALPRVVLAVSLVRGSPATRPGTEEGRTEGPAALTGSTDIRGVSTGRVLLTVAGVDAVLLGVLSLLALVPLPA